MSDSLSLRLTQSESQIWLLWAYLKHLPVTGQAWQMWQTTPRCLSGFSLSGAVKSFAAFFTCSWSNFKELNSSLHRGHFTISSLSESFWWSVQTFIQEMWTLLPQPNLRGRDEDSKWEHRKSVCNMLQIQISTSFCYVWMKCPLLWLSRDLDPILLHPKICAGGFRQSWSV